MRIVMLGPPGAGKGTQARLISQDYKIPLIVAGDILREEAKKDKEIRRYIEDGKLVPDDVIFGIIIKRIETTEKSGFVLDGFPRNLYQAKKLDGYLLEREKGINHVFFIDVPFEALIERISSRRICENCGAVYNLITNPPERNGICNICGGTLVQRNDDKEDVVRRRLEVYMKETHPVIEFYKRKGILRNIKGNGAIEEVYAKIMDVIEGYEY